MGIYDELIRRAILTEAVPMEEIQQFAEEIGKMELFQELTNTAIIQGNIEENIIEEQGLTPCSFNFDSEEKFA